MPIAACAKRLRVPLKNIWSRAPPVSNAAKTVDDHCRRMMLQERGKKAPPEPAAGDIDPLRILVDVPPRLTPLSAAPQIDEVRVVEQKLVAPMAGQQHPRATLPDCREAGVRAAPLRVEQWCFGVPDGLP